MKEYDARKDCGARRSEHSWESFPLAPWATRRRQDLLNLMERLNPNIEHLRATIAQEAEKRPEERRLMTHPGVGPLTTLAFELIIGSPERLRCGKQIGSYVGLIPCEDSSAGHQRLGHIGKQDNSLLRFLLVEAAQAAVRHDPDWRRRHLHLAMGREPRTAKAAIARKVGVHLYWI
jgi:transposase